jgi:hypothetical protein
MLDGTPVLDLKPYVPWSDAIPHARTGWLAPPEYHGHLDDEGRPEDPQRPTVVVFDPLAREQLDWLASQGERELEPRIVQALSLGAKRHPYRRIQRDGDALKLAVKAWRARFVTSDDRTCTVLSIKTGYRPDALDEDRDELAAHRAFVARWGWEFAK